METRKVQLSGGTTYTISLPKTWAKEHGIESGSVLALHPNGDGSLLVEAAADRETVERSTTVDVSAEDHAETGRRVEAAHAAGIDSITFVDRTGHPPDRHQSVEDALTELSGFEIIETSDTRIRLQNLIDADNVDVRQSTLRLRLVMLAMHRDALTAIVEGDEQLAHRVVQRDNEADKLFAMITRHFRRSLSDLHEVEKLDRCRDGLFEYYYTARQLERVADHAEKIARFVIDPDATVPTTYDSRLLELGEASRNVVDDAADIVLDAAGIETASNALDRRDQLLEDLDSLDRDLYDHDDPGEAYVLGLLCDSLRRTAEYGVNVVEIGLQKVIRESIQENR